MRTLQTEVEGLTRKIKYQDKALQLLLSSRRHHEALSALVHTSITDNFHYIPRVGMPDFLEFLRLAVDRADGFEGVGLRPLRWYREVGSRDYYVDLRHRTMRYKRRWLVLDDDEADCMIEDVQDAGTLAQYWAYMGDVQTFWLRERDFARNLPKFERPRDMALYDREMYFSYDEDKQLLYFDVLDETSPQHQMFAQLQQISGRGVDWIHEVPRSPALAAVPEQPPCPDGIGGATG